MTVESPRSLTYKAALAALLLIGGLPYGAPLDVKHMPSDRSPLTQSGDIFSFILPVVGTLSTLGCGLYAKDPILGAKAILGTTSVLYTSDLLKRTFNETSLGRRPNGYSQSFPSAHSSNAFYGARLIHKNFGIEYGIPAYALATLTAYSRVAGKYHHVHDVAAGALLAFTVDYLLDLSIENVTLIPIVGYSFDGSGMRSGLSFQINF